MKITNKLKTNTSCFGHIEMLLVIVAVVIIGAVAFFVYQNHNKKTATKTTAHAGSWHHLSSTFGYNVYACYTSVGYLNENVKILLAKPANLPGTYVISNFTPNHYGAGSQTVLSGKAWWAGTVAVSPVFTLWSDGHFVVGINNHILDTTGYWNNGLTPC